jgi:hypothetical protein
MTHIEKLHLDAITSEVYIIPKYGQDEIADADKAAAKSAEVTENIACEFAEWINNRGYTQVEDGFFASLIDLNGKSTKQLFQEYLKTKENDTPNN